MNNLYLITGDETYEKKECLQKIKEKFDKLVKGINYIVLDKDTIFNLEAEINTYPFGYSKKLIVVNIENKSSKDSEEVNTKNDFFTNSLEETLLELDESVCVVFIGDFTLKSKIYKFVSQNGKCFNFEKRKENEIIAWCTEKFKENEIKISNQDVAYLVSLCGTDKLTLKNEIDKLCSYAMHTKIIEKKDIDKLCIKTSDVIIFDLTNSLGSKNYREALYFLDELIENKEPIQKIVIMIAKHFKSLLVTKIAIEKNKDVMNELNAKSSYAVNKYKEQARRFTKQELVSVINKLAKLDIDSKLGKIDLKIGLEKIICGA